LIGIEGIDAVGKQTQSALLDSWLRRNGFASTLMSFPDYETPIGQQIQGFLSGRLDFPPQVRHLLFAANRWEKAPLISRMEGEDRVLIVNRYTESNIAYGVANGLPVDWLLGLEAGIPKTDLVIVLDAPAPALVSRRPGKDSYEKDNALQRKTRKVYKELAPRFGWKVVEATGGIEEVHSSVLAIVQEGLRGRKS
jgi:dTMP kinase